MGTDSLLQKLAGDDDDGDCEDDIDTEDEDDKDDRITVEAYRATCASHRPAMRASMMSAGGLIKKRPTNAENQHCNDQVL